MAVDERSGETHKEASVRCKRAELFVPLSVALVAISILVERIGGSSAWGNFIAGVLLGMSLTLAVFAAIMAATGRQHE